MYHSQEIVNYLMQMLRIDETTDQYSMTNSVVICNSMFISSQEHWSLRLKVKEEKSIKRTWKTQVKKV